jgi:predicted aspartyl protease
VEIATVGKVIVSAKVENLIDLAEVDRGFRTGDQVRWLEVTDALVDTGATFLSMPKRLIDQLGLTRYRTRQARTSGGIVDFGMYGMVQLTVQGRDCKVEVAELPDNCPVLIGQIPLESLDFIVDPVNQRLLGNPDHNGQHMFDMF